MHQPPPEPVQIVESILNALLPPLVTAGIVVIFVIFIFFQRGDLRDRFIGLTGTHDLHRTTAGLNEARHGSATISWRRRESTLRSHCASESALR